jgi:DNA-binding NtrC family response regulator
MAQTAARPFNVLVVDDEPDVRDLLVEYFRDRGHDVSSAADGRAAIDELERNPSKYTLVVSDLQLPNVDGLGVLKAARALNPSVTVIIVTGYASLDTAVQAVRLGAYDYLTKPFSLGQIDVIIQRAAERWMLEAENRQLARRVGDQTTADVGGDVGSRLDAIDARLARIEELLGRMLADRPRP